MGVKKEVLKEVFCYVDQVITNEDGNYDDLGGAWFIVPESWLEVRVKESGFKNIEDFYDTYTYDDTDGWINKAMKEGVLRGVGCGINPFLI